MTSLHRIGAFLFALSPALLTAACAEQAAAPFVPPPREIEVLTLAPTEVKDTGEYLGTLLSRESVNVLSQVAGYVRKIHVRPGQRVEAGAPLLDIDSREENAALDSALAHGGSATARLDLARQTLQRTENLYQAGLVSTQELERARSDLVAASAAAKAAAATVAQRQVMLQFHTIRAAVPGVIGEVQVRIGDYVNAGTQLTSIAQADVLEISVAVPADRARTLLPEAPLEVLDGAGNVSSSRDARTPPPTAASLATAPHCRRTRREQQASSDVDDHRPTPALGAMYAHDHAVGQRREPGDAALLPVQQNLQGG